MLSDSGPAGILCTLEPLRPPPSSMATLGINLQNVTIDDLPQEGQERVREEIMSLMLRGCHVGPNVISQILRKEFESSGLGDIVKQEGDKIRDNNSTLEEGGGGGEIGVDEHEEGIADQGASMEHAHDDARVEDHDTPEMVASQPNRITNVRHATIMEYVDENVPPSIDEDMDAPQHLLLDRSWIHARIDRSIEGGWMTGETVERDLGYSPYPYISTFYSGY
ncbi:hypothetical protein NEOLEDRAFT_1139253 [Neolentinus lepideus HHB14362 ss-1]|uniref:Uncharacterized protein n=1 Tax=Neolentinus lepideus HHB14362 ss-1 TaxID=1314782 RepID=A0A165PSS6_9AGAM|nr:hypothetical protein NEOLEDRAFT_1139253 [Neolentinus lepideus HHB14362 ss-1]